MLGAREKRKHIIFLLLGLVFFSIFIYYTSHESLEKLTSIKILPLIGAIAASVILTGSIAGRWGSLSNFLSGSKIASWFHYYYYFIVSRAWGFILPKEITDIGFRFYWLIKRHGATAVNAGASVAYDRLFDLLFMLVFLAAVIPYWFQIINETYAVILIITFPLILGITILLFNNRVFSFLNSVINLVLKVFSKIPVINNKLPQKITVTILEKKLLLKIYFLSILKFGSTVARLILFAWALDLSISPAIILLGAPIGQLSYLFSFTPGGLGIFEAGWLAVLLLAGVEEQTALSFVVGQRILTVLIICGLAALSHLIFSARKTIINKY